MHRVSWAARRAALAIALAIVLATPPAQATIRHEPVRLQIAGEIPVLRPGVSARLAFELAAASEVTIADLAVESGSLARPFARRAAPQRAAPGDPYRFELEVLPADPPAPLLIRYTLDGAEREVTIDLVPLLEYDPEGAPQTRLVPDAARNTVRDPALLALRPEPAPGPGARPATPSGGQGGASYTLVGRLAYMRGDFGGEIAGADGITVIAFDYDPVGPHDELGRTTTNPNGDFWIGFHWDPTLPGDGYPDIFLRFETANSIVKVRPIATFDRYFFSTPTLSEHTLVYTDFGTILPTYPTHNGALLIASNIARNWRWYNTREGYSPSDVTILWPDGNNAYYDTFFNEIHIGQARTWNDGTHAHEYGHNWVDEYADFEYPDYCNGYCDDSECGHCNWCPETDHDALNEGWANWIGHVQTSSYAADYGLVQVVTRSAESVLTCADPPGDPPFFAEPSITEGFIQAVLQDIWDSGPGSDDDDPSGLFGKDQLELGTDEIFDVMDIDEPTTAMGFLATFRDRFPQYREKLWETAMNCRWDIDDAYPEPPWDLWSSTHPPNVPIDGGTISFHWTEPTDDWSGVGGYSYEFGPTPVPPDFTQDYPDLNFMIYGPVGPGTYYLTLRAIDRAGNPGWSYVTYGPMIITPPDPADLAPHTLPGWPRPMVARAAANSTPTSAPDPTAPLPGNAASTYLNLGGKNQGESSYLRGFREVFYVDGVPNFPWVSLGTVDPGATFHIVNYGPIPIRGGRHMIGTIIDTFHDWWESDEANNYWSRPWIWSPLVLAAGTAVRRMAPPPNPTGSWAGVRDGSPLHYNCDGLRFTGSGWWNAVWVAADADTDDYDCRLHFATASPDTGFDVVRAWSGAGAGRLDAVLLNRNTTGGGTWDVGVLNDLDVTNDGAPQGSFVVKHVTSNLFPFGDSAEVALPDSEYVVLLEVLVGVGDVGPVTVHVTCAPGEPPVHALWLHRTFTYGSLLDAAPYATTWPDGQARLDVTAGAAGYYCLVLYRDPKDGREARTVTVEIERTPPDILPAQLAGWYRPLVPRPTADATGASVPAPGTLNGSGGPTYVNLAARNESPTAVIVPPAFEVRLDGAPVFGSLFFGINPYTDVYWNNLGPITVASGRHVLSVAHDPADAVAEGNEDNNRWGEQWVWDPVTLLLDTPAEFEAPPDPLGGFADLTAGTEVWFNCRGLRVLYFGAPGSNTFGAIALMPADTFDVDLRLHPFTTGTQDGFGETFATSSWGKGESEYVLLHWALVPWGTWDLGVVGSSSGTRGPSSIVASLSGAPVAPSGTLGPFTVDPDRVLNVHPVTLDAGAYEVRLLDESGTVDFGLSVHSGDLAYQGKSDALAAQWLAPPGTDEYLLFTADSAGVYAVAAWKRGSASLSETGTYSLLVTAAAVATPGPAGPQATRLSHAAPSPFRDRTTIAYDLAAGGEIALSVFDPAGAHVRTLERGWRPPGRHQVVWDGKAEDGRELASGVYLVRLEAGPVRETRKVIRLR
jgi:hypothetical protein